MSNGEGPAPHKWLIAGSVMIGTIMAVLDSSIVNVALPGMSGTLGVTIEQITWVVTGYILANVIIMPLVALLSQRFGRKNFYLTSVVLFTVASMACGFARTLPVMVAFRAVQGIGGGVLMTVSQAILRETFPPEEQGTAMGIFGLGVVLAPAFGPTLGGWLTDHYSWPWIFFINVPIGIINLIMVSRFVEDPSYLVRRKGDIDWLGLSLMILGLGSLQLMLESGERNDWFESGLVVRLLIVAIVGLIAFVWRELKAEHPAVDLRILKNVSFSSATALGGVLGMGLMGSLFLLPVFLQNLLGYPALKSGVALMPRSLAMAVIMPIGGRFYNRLGPRVLVGAGLIVSGLSFWQLSHLTTTVGFWDIFWPQVWQGVGFSLIFVALSTAALATIAKPDVTAATGLYNVSRNIFGSIGIAISASQLTTGTNRFHEMLAERASVANSVAVNWLSATTAAMMARTGADVETAKRMALKLLDATIWRQAAVLAYNRVFIGVALLFVIALPLVFLLKRGHAVEGEMELMVE
jgi:MFS transporter, DHA2 family, multidrug resistance protein